MGDAAQTRDPLSGGGMGAAVESASSAARALLAFLGGDCEAIAHHEWVQRLEFATYLRYRAAYYAQETRWVNAPFWQRRRIVAVSPS